MSGIAANFSGAHDNSGFINLLAGVGLAMAGGAGGGGGGGRANPPVQQVAPVGQAGGNGVALTAPATSASGDATDTGGYAGGARPTPTSMTPSFISSAALPNYLPPPLTSNAGGKSLVGQ